MKWPKSSKFHYKIDITRRAKACTLKEKLSSSSSSKIRDNLIYLFRRPYELFLCIRAWHMAVQWWQKLLREWGLLLIFFASVFVAVAQCYDSKIRLELAIWMNAHWMPKSCNTKHEKNWASLLDNNHQELSREKNKFFSESMGEWLWLQGMHIWIIQNK